MPLYEYKCSQCQTKFEVIQKVNEPPLKKCIKCGGAVTKTISAPAIQFKGSGWYITDYAKKDLPAKEKPPKTQEKKEIKTQEGKETKKSDAPSSKDEKPASPSTK